MVLATQLHWEAQGMGPSAAQPACNVSRWLETMPLTEMIKLNIFKLKYKMHIEKCIFHSLMIFPGLL